jgi:hypothetical protein
MKLAAGIIIFAIVFAVIYGVLFSYSYRLTPITNELLFLFGLLGLATSFILAGVWAAINRTRTRAEDDPSDS